jgi:hypothetical protein
MGYHAHSISHSTEATFFSSKQHQDKFWLVKNKKMKNENENENWLGSNQPIQYSWPFLPFNSDLERI